MKSSALHKIKDFFLYNWQKKLISIALAVGLWLYVNLQEYEDQTLNLPIQYVNIPSEMAILEKSDEITTLTVRARKNKLENLDLTTIAFPEVDLSDAIIGEAYYPINYNISNENTDLVITHEKEEVRLFIDKTVSKEVNISLLLTGTTVSGYNVDSIVQSADTTTISGPSLLIDSIDSIDTEPIDIATSTNIYLDSVALVVEDNVSITGEDTVAVRITVTEKRMNKEVVIPVTLINLDAQYESAYTPEISVIVELPEKWIFNYESRISVTADCLYVSGTGRQLLPITITANSDIDILDSVEYISVEFVESSNQVVE